MSVRFQITALISLMVNAVIFGIGTIAVLSIPYLNEDAKFWLPIAVVASLILSPGISWFIAPRLRNRYWQNRQSSQS